MSATASDEAPSMFNFLASCRREREAVRELSRLTSLDLADLGMGGSGVRDLARDGADAPRPRPARGEAEAAAVACGTHDRRAVA